MLKKKFQKKIEQEKTKYALNNFVSSLNLSLPRLKIHLERIVFDLFAGEEIMEDNI